MPFSPIIEASASLPELDAASAPPDAEPSSLAFLAAGGKVGALMRAHDWSASPFGRPET
jgi:hypothetical protein